ncbi:hypothetical protein GOHSU_16_00640 [Gordonia hirsuta DSM 44140 = NBRC 16056]|uniref:Mce-associated membrane protein n=1 Tax=Gordonia hirsuta DSM 44140 = NBRC 16056 TaxID=1121927 RepID=L7LAQ4_9ACTN|nr:hypothetical protein [Gordonia hirsuta]GAC57108.1 hypothetical protein GOHSU_16_00640 [Gordonia hirsuta DSM 44140 = NBRC 16056]
MSTSEDAAEPGRNDATDTAADDAAKETDGAAENTDDAAEKATAEKTPPVTALTADERAELLAKNRSAREEARLKEAAKKAAGTGAAQDSEAADDDGGDGDSNGHGDGDGDDTGDRTRVPGRIATASRAAGARRFLPIGLSAVIAGLVVAVAVLAILLVRASDDGLGPDSGIGAQALTDAKDYAAAVVTYSPDDYSALDRKIREISTPDFADRFITSSQQAREGNDEAKATSRGSAVDAGLMSISRDQAVVLVALDHSVTSPELPSAGEEGLEYQSRVRVTLTRDGDRWLLGDLVTF